MKTDQIKAELLAIQASSSDGLLHAEEIVDWARKAKNSALHSQFEWDDRTAAAEHRLWQARRLVQLHIVSDDRRPQMVSLKIDRGNGGGYRRVEDVLTNKDLTQAMLDDALAELQRVEDKYQWLKSLEPVWEEVRKVRSRRPRREERATA